MKGLEVSGNELYLKQLVNFCPQPMLMVDQFGSILSTNQAFLQGNAVFSTLTPKDLIGKSYRLVSVLLGVEYENDFIIRALKGEIINQRFDTVDDKVWLINALPIKDEQDTILAAVGFFFDVTEYEFAQKESHKREQALLTRFNQVIDIMPIPLVELDKTGVVKTLSKGFFDYDYKGFSKVDFIGKPFSELLLEGKDEYQKTGLPEALKGISTHQKHLKLREHDWLVSSIPLWGETGEIMGALGLLQNITEYEKMWPNVIQLERLNLLGEMAAGVAHEVRNPLTVIKGYLQFLASKVDENIKEKFGVVLIELQRVEAIITDFLSLAKYREVELDQRNLNNIIKGIFPLIFTDAMKNGVDIQLALDMDLPNTMLNEEEIKQVILNLARNSIQAVGSSGGTLIIKTSCCDDSIALYIIDNGCGIPEEVQKKIFDPFFTTKENGTGLGLSVCANVVRRLNGKLDIKSEVGHGTTVLVTLPII